jgi:hypothetical protein
MPHCESAVVVPVVDVLGALSVVVVGSLITLAVLGDGGPESAALEIGGVSLGAGILLTGSSVVGFGRAERCRRAIDAATAAGRQLGGGRASSIGRVGPPHAELVHARPERVRMDRE